MKRALIIFPVVMLCIVMTMCLTPAKVGGSLDTLDRLTDAAQISCSRDTSTCKASSTCIHSSADAGRSCKEWNDLVAHCTIAACQAQIAIQQVLCSKSIDLAASACKPFEVYHADSGANHGDGDLLRGTDSGATRDQGMVTGSADASSRRDASH